MSEATPMAGGASGDRPGAAALGLAQWLRLAATPTFAAMALLTAGSGGPALCSSGHAGPLGGMAVMYLLMAAFHAPPWLALIRGAPGPRAHPRPPASSPARPADRKPA